MSNSSPIRTASTSRFTLSTFTLRTDATTYFPLVTIPGKFANFQLSHLWASTSRYIYSRPRIAVRTIWWVLRVGDDNGSVAMARVACFSWEKVSRPPGGTEE